MEKVAVSVKDVNKKYLSVQALDHVSFDVPAGSLFGIIGPDGAGKTTLFRIMATLLLPDDGHVEILGYDTMREFREIRKRIGYMPGKFSLYQDLTVEENLTLFASVFNTTIAENYHLIQDIYKQIEPFRQRRAGKLSGGMKQKLALCCAMIHKPDVLFLDEPTTGVDPVSRKEFWQMLDRLKKQGITIVVSTPYMDEASKCDLIALMTEGRFLKIDTPDNIVLQFGKALYKIKSTDKISALKCFSNLSFVENCYAFGDSLHLVVSSGMDMKQLKAGMGSLYHGEELEEVTPTVEDCFMDLVNNRL